MLKRLATMVGALLLGGCAALMNSNRPSYNGPIVPPVWHNDSVKVEQKPVIHDGAVYAVASPLRAPESPRVVAFDLHTGKTLWTGGFAAKEILLGAGARLFVTDTGGGVHALNAKTGAASSDYVSFSKATLSDGVLYAENGAMLEARRLDSLPTVSQRATERTPPLWQVPIPVDFKFLRAPVVAGGAVYIHGFSPSDILAGKRAFQGLYAFDAKTGALRWKWEFEDRVDAFLTHSLAADKSAAYLWMVDKTQSVFGKGLLIVFDAATGREKWRRNTSLFVAAIDAPLLFDSNAVVIPDYPAGKEGTAEEAGYVYRALDRAKGDKVWESQTPWKYQMSGAFEGLLFASDKNVHQVLNENNSTSPDSWVSAVSVRTGKELWRSPTVELGVFTPPAAAEGMVVVGSKPFIWASDPPVAGKDAVAGIYAWRQTQ